MPQKEIFGLGATVVSLTAMDGTHFPTKISPPAGCAGFFMKVLTGASTGILPNAVSGASMAGATTITGYHLPVGTDYRIDGPAVFYLGAMATSTVQFCFWFSQGASLG